MLDRSLAARFAARPAWYCPPRVETPEWLDQGRGTPADVAANLAEMWRLNRRLGGVRALTRHLYPRLQALSGPLTVLDLGTGAADLPIAIARWASARGLAVQVWALDWSARNLAVARRRAAQVPAVALVRADAACLPLAPRSVDFVIASLFLHHLAPEAAVTVLCAAYAAARHSLIVTDLVRGWLPLLAFKLVQPVFARHPLTRHDGALSIRRAYTPDEVQALAGAAGLEGARVHGHWPWRLTLVADRAGHG